MKAIIASAITSIIVSLFTFILGLKSGKNQADRALLQDLYKRLYSHFSELETGLKEKRPKRWTDYQCIKESNIIRYYPVVREMERTGDILHVNDKIARQALELGKYLEKILLYIIPNSLGFNLLISIIFPVINNIVLKTLGLL